MKHLIKNLFISTLVIASNIIGCCSNDILSCNQITKTLFIPISQGQNLYTQYHKPIFLNENECWGSEFNLIYRYAKNKNGSCIAPTIFQYNPITFIGGGMDNAINPDLARPINALVPEYFGLADDTISSVYLNPTIVNNIIDLQIAVGGEKLWIQVNAPIVYTNWQVSPDTTPNPPVGSLLLDNSNLVKMATDANPIYTVGETLNLGLGNVDSTIDYINPYLIANADIPLKSTPNGIISETNTSIGLGNWISPDFGVSLTGTPVTVLSADVDTLNIFQSSVTPSSNISTALGGYTFGDVKSRKYNLFNFGDNGAYSTRDWGVADLITQIGWEFCKTNCKNFSPYIRFVIPCGTNLNKNWARYIFSPIIGNGKHFELGAGLNGSTTIWNSNEGIFKVHLDGYITHVFSASTFRSFDKKGLPMSRYAILKSFTLDENSKYSYNGLFPLGDISAKFIDTNFNIRGEAVIDFILAICNWQLGFGYSFSGLSGENETCSSCNKCNTNTTTKNYYGFKGINSLVSFNFTSLLTSFPAALPISSNNGTFSANSSPYVSPADSGAYLYGIPGSEEIFSNEQLQSNESGLMCGQILNRLFAHLEYIWAENCWEPELGVFGSIGFGSGSYVTAEYWDLGARFGLTF